MAESFIGVPLLLCQKAICVHVEELFFKIKKHESFFSCSFSAVSRLDKQNNLINFVKMKHVQKDGSNINIKMLGRLYDSQST